MIDNYFNHFGITWGILLILAVGIVFFLLVSFVLEKRTRKIYPEHKKPEGGGFFDFDDDEEEN